MRNSSVHWQLLNSIATRHNPSFDVAASDVFGEEKKVYMVFLTTSLQENRVEKQKTA